MHPLRAPAPPAGRLLAVVTARSALLGDEEPVLEIGVLEDFQAVNLGLLGELLLAPPCGRGDRGPVSHSGPLPPRAAAGSGSLRRPPGPPLGDVQGQVVVIVLEHLDAELLRLLGELRLAVAAHGQVEGVAPLQFLGLLAAGAGLGQPQQGGKDQEGRYSAGETLGSQHGGLTLGTAQRSQRLDDCIETNQSLPPNPLAG